MKNSMYVMGMVVVMVTLLTALVVASPATIVQAKKHHLTDTEKEDGTATDKVGRPCNEGPHHDQCHDQFLESKEGGNILPAGPGKHLGECEEVGNDGHLACEVLNDSEN